MKEFIEIYDINDLTSEVWTSLSTRPVHEMRNDTDKFRLKKTRYTDQIKAFSREEGNEFSGILNYFMKKTEGNIDQIVNITSSSHFNNSDGYKALNVVYFNDSEKYFWTNDSPNSWICFDFKDRRIIPTDYTIKSIKCPSNYSHPKSWALEGSNDYRFWEILDLEQNCSFLNGPDHVHTFNIHKQIKNEFRYIRMRQTGPNWRGNNFLAFKSFELYGKLI